MIKKGFTLAEVLITLSIVGVIATISMTTLKTDAHKKMVDTSLKVAKTDIEDVFAEMMLDDEVPTLSETKFWLTVGNDGRHNILKDYIKCIRVNNKFDENYAVSFELKNGAQLGIDFDDTNDDADAGWIAGAIFDANGDKAPNTIRTKENPNGDRVYAHITEDGLIEFVEEE